MEDLVLTFLRERKALVNLTGLATAAGLSPRTLKDYVDGARGKRGLPPETVQALVHAIEGLRAPWAPK
jgi:hypothetical protein